MQTADILRRTPIQSSFRVEQIRGLFDLQHQEIVHEWHPKLPLQEQAWNIGLIVGPSGSGKTTVAAELFPKAHFHKSFDWAAKKSFLDSFDEKLSIKEITAALNAVGFSSPPHWLKPFNHLSTGQKFRAELARCILLEAPFLIFDEFTSVVDRQVAKICSAAVSKIIRKRQRPQLIALSCHFDIIDWLQPDWIYDVAADRFEWRRLRRHPEISLTIYETDRAAWQLFRDHHYLSHDISNSAQCYVAFWNDQPCAFASVIHHPHADVPNFKREHRTVVLPDFQGIGIGNRLSEFIAAQYTAKGFRYISTTSHPAMIRHRAAATNWRMLRGPSHANKQGKRSTTYGTYSTGRITACFEFIGKTPDTVKAAK